MPDRGALGPPSNPTGAAPVYVTEMRVLITVDVVSNLCIFITQARMKEMQLQRINSYRSFTILVFSETRVNTD